MSQKFIIPEEIPTNERTAFHGAAAAAAKAGKSHFNFGGKKHPVTMKKDTAHKIVDQKEGTDEAKRVVHSDNPKRLVTGPKKKSGETATMNPKLVSEKGKGSEMEQKEMTIRDKLMSVLEKRDDHYKSAAEAEPMDNNLKGAGAKKMKADYAGNAADPDLEKKSHDDAAKAGRTGPSKKMRPNDNSKGDSKIVNQPVDTTKNSQAPAVRVEKYDTMSGLKAAYASMYEDVYKERENRADEHEDAARLHDDHADDDAHATHKGPVNKDALNHHAQAAKHHEAAASHYRKGNYDQALRHATKAGEHSQAAKKLGSTDSGHVHDDTKHLHNQKPLQHPKSIIGDPYKKRTRLGHDD